MLGSHCSPPQSTGEALCICIFSQNTSYQQGCYIQAEKHWHTLFSPTGCQWKAFPLQSSRELLSHLCFLHWVGRDFGRLPGSHLRPSGVQLVTCGWAASLPGTWRVSHQPLLTTTSEERQCPAPPVLPTSCHSFFFSISSWNPLQFNSHQLALYLYPCFSLTSSPSLIHPRPPV